MVLIPCRDSKRMFLCLPLALLCSLNVSSTSRFVVAFTTPSVPTPHVSTTKNLYRGSRSTPAGESIDRRSVWAKSSHSSSSNLFLSSLSSSAATIDLPTSQASSSKTSESISKLAAMLTKVGMMAFIISMCLTLPIALLPPWALHKLGFITKVKQQQMALGAGQFCARWLLRLIPFCRVKCEPAHQPKDAEPSIWVCNHTSALDVFMLLANDLKLRGRYKRPIKIVYWKGLEDNPITKLLFQQCGFIPVQMAANAAGDANNYDVTSFKNLLKKTKEAFNEGFDIGILPEGQLNPHPTEKLLPIFPGAYTLAKMSKRPIHMMALHGTHKLWHAREDIGMTVTGRDITMKVYPGGGRKYTSPDEFVETFQAVVGSYATTGHDLEDEELAAWLDGTKWATIQESKEKEDKANGMKLREELESTTNHGSDDDSTAMSVSSDKKSSASSI